MKSESTLVVEAWEIFRDFVPAARKVDTAMSFLRCFEEFGFEASDFEDILDEDDTLTAAYRLLFGRAEDDDEEEFGYED